MPQQTLVLMLAPDAGAALERQLAGEGFEMRGLPHARFSARQEGLTVTLYASGKLVIQGHAPELFAERVLGRAPGPREEAGERTASATSIGSDEAGKGDFFGPLVVAAVRLEPDEVRSLEGGSVRDSKRVDDESVRRLAAALWGRFPCAVRRLDPEEYNRRHAETGNLNLLLAELHGEVLRELCVEGAVAVVDQFARPELVERALGAVPMRLEQRVQAEVLPAVAAASIVARAGFLDGLQELSDAWGVDLHKGAGTPADRSAMRFLAVHGRERLGSVAKMHFKNAQRLGAGRAT